MALIKCDSSALEANASCGYFVTHGDGFGGLETRGLGGRALVIGRLSTRRPIRDLEGELMRDSIAAQRPADRVSIVIPARNEARNLPHVLGALPADLHEVIVVDGHSVDDTVNVALRVRPDVKIVQQTRRGKGNALACGFAVVTGDIVVMLDADGSADPSEIPAFVAALTAGAEFAKGTRFDRGGDSHDITRFRRIGNAALNRLVNLIFGTRYTDLCYGYNALRVHLLPLLNLPSVQAADNLAGGMQWGDGFEIETLINVRAARVGARIAEVGSTEKARLHGVSNLRAIPDGIRVLRTILAERHRLDEIDRVTAEQETADGRLDWMVRDAVPDQAAVEGLVGEST